MSSLKAFLLLVFCYFSFSSSAQSNNQDMSIYILQSIEDIDLSKSDYKVIKDKDRSDNEFSYGLYVPKLEKDQSASFALALHWSSTTPTFKEFAKCLIIPAYTNQDAIVIIPDARGSTWFTIDNEQLNIDIMTSVYSSLPVRKERATVTGYSDGGNMSWYISEHYADLFSFAIPIASAYQSDGEIKLPAYAIHGKDDELLDINTTHNFIKEYKKKGADIKWKAIKGRSHFDACNYNEALSKAIDWVNAKAE